LNFLPIFIRTSLPFSGDLPTSNVSLTTPWNALANCAGPDTDAEKALSNIDYDAHNLSIIFILESLTNRGKHDMEPELIDRNVALLLELVGPLAAMLILDILPLWSYAFLEQVVVGLEGQLGGWSNVVLTMLATKRGKGKCQISRRHPRTPQLS